MNQFEWKLIELCDMHCRSNSSCSISPCNNTLCLETLYVAFASLRCSGILNFGLFRRSWWRKDAAKDSVSYAFRRRRRRRRPSPRWTVASSASSRCMWRWRSARKTVKRTCHLSTCSVSPTCVCSRWVKYSSLAAAVTTCPRCSRNRNGSTVPPRWPRCDRNRDGLPSPQCDRRRRLQVSVPYEDALIYRRLRERNYDDSIFEYASLFTVCWILYRERADVSRSFYETIIGGKVRICRRAVS